MRATKKRPGKSLADGAVMLDAADPLHAAMASLTWEQMLKLLPPPPGDRLPNPPRGVSSHEQSVLGKARQTEACPPNISK